MRACVAVVLLAACAGDSTTLRVERQPATLDDTTDDAWLAGGVVLVGEPGAFTYPQPVSVRVSLVERDVEMAEPKLISRTTIAAFDDEGTFEITRNPVCQPTHCEAELRLNASGVAMLQVTATGKDGDEVDCFYYAVYEDADPAGATAARYDEIEVKQRDCLQALLD